MQFLATALLFFSLVTGRGRRRCLGRTPQVLSRTTACSLQFTACQLVGNDTTFGAGRLGWRVFRFIGRLAVCRLFSLLGLVLSLNLGRLGLLGFSFGGRLLSRFLFRLGFCGFGFGLLLLSFLSSLAFGFDGRGGLGLSLGFCLCFGFGFGGCLGFRSLLGGLFSLQARLLLQPLLRALPFLRLRFLLALHRARHRPQHPYTTLPSQLP